MLKPFVSLRSLFCVGTGIETKGTALVLTGSLTEIPSEILLDIAVTILLRLRLEVETQYVAPTTALTPTSSVQS